MSDTVTKRGRKEIFAKRDVLVRVLREVRSGAATEKPKATYFLQRRLADAGLVDFVAVKGEGRGRPRKVAVLTREGAFTLATV
jgi:DNA-binding PadR family transcriptional regulator